MIFGVIFGSTRDRYLKREAAIGLNPLYHRRLAYLVDIDDNPDAPGRYGVRGIPTMILFKGGVPAATKVGMEPKRRLKAWLEDELA